jgi:hypothetical protein
MNATAFLARLPVLIVAPALLTLLMPTPVVTQADTSELVNPSFISFEHDGKAVAGFVAYATAEGAPAIRFDFGSIRPDRNGKVVARMPALPPGIYRLEIAAYNSAGESPRVQAAPARFRVTEQKGARPSRKESPKPKRSFLGKLYGAVVGSDEEEAGK